MHWFWLQYCALQVLPCQSSCAICLCSICNLRAHAICAHDPVSPAPASAHLKLHAEAKPGFHRTLDRAGWKAGAANPLVHLALQAPVRRLRGGDGDDDGRRPAHPHLELKSPITYITDCKVSGMCDLTSQSPLWKMWNVHIFGLPFQWQSDDSLVLKCRTKTGRAD